jgi:hypothetical protein
VSDVLSRLRQDYASAFVGYLVRGDETCLDRAYDLGRRATERLGGVAAVPDGVLDPRRVPLA